MAAPELNVAALEDRAYWLRLMAREADEATLPLDRPRPTVTRPRRAAVTLAFPDSLSAGLRTLTKASPFLLYTVLLAGVMICLRRYGAAGVVVAGSPPRRSGNGGAVAPNALPIAFEFPDGATFRDVIVALRERLNEAYGRQSYDCTRLADELGREAARNRAPLFDVAVACPEIHGPLADLGQDVTVTLSAGGPAIAVDIAYNERLFERATVDRFAGHMVSLLAAALADVGTPVDLLPLLTEAERSQLAAWNDTRTDNDRADPVSLFEAQVARRPQATAVEFEQETRSYDTLNRRANRIAHWLRARGIGPDRPVGVLAERSIALIEVVLGILKAGAFVVPLDPGYPRERLAFMLRDAGVALLLAERHPAGRLPAHGADTAFIEDLDGALAGIADDDPAPAAGPQHLLYLLYTSGSTGWPKGVAMTRAAIANLIAWQTSGRSEATGERTLQFASLNFDVSFQEIFATLSRGGVLVLIRDALRRERGELVRFVTERAITRLFLPVVAFKELAQGVLERGAAPPALREIVTAGEQLQLDDATVAMMRQLEGCGLNNQYGPTETHVVTSHVLAGSPGRWPVLPPIGRPIDNCRIHILDRRLERVPVGVVGEVYIAGDCLARGYWNRPAATAERFLPDPFAAAPGARMYRTGDLARWRADGNIEFLGRADHQVKIRGYRVELGEIEVTLAQHASVAAAAVVADAKGGAEQARLIAHVVPAPGAQPEASELRRFLEGRLPNYMIPALFAPIDALPLTPSGKLDRRALPDPESLRAGAEASHVAPRDAVEQRLAAIWSEVLQLERVGIHDNFFVLGGHSLLVAQVLARVRRVFKYEMPAHVMFDAPTVAQVAERLRAAELPQDDIARLAAELNELPAEQRELLLQQPAG